MLAIAAGIVGENRLPHAGAQARRRQRVAEDLAKDVVEGAAGLKAEGEWSDGVRSGIWKLSRQA